MRQSREEPSCSVAQAIDIILAVKELNRLSSQEFNKLLKDSENFTIHYHSEKQMLIRIDVEKLASFLPLHLMAVLTSSDRNEALFQYLLCGIRLLHSLCDLAPRHAKLEQILLDDVKVSEQMLDLVFYLLIVLGGYTQENYKFSRISFLHPALVACSLYLLTGCISSQFPDLVQVLIAHPKVDVFMDAAFDALHEAIRILDSMLSAHDVDSFSTNLTFEKVVNYTCLQCEASLQFLHTLCQQKGFRERLLSNKELCGKGGVLYLARAILKLKITQPLLLSSKIEDCVSRLQAKVLSILLSLCEVESISYLDEVSSSQKTLDLAKSVALQVLELLKTALSRDPKLLSTSSEKTYPTGLLQLNAMRLADIFSDDSNFRSYITVNFTRDLAAIFSLSHGDFLTSWCSSDLPLREVDATLEYDSFAAAGWALDSISSLNMPNAKNMEYNLVPNTMAPSSYAHQRTSLFVKVIANLHCFVPTICEEQERNLFLHRFVDCLKMNPFKAPHGFWFTSDPPQAANVCRNLRSLLSHAESLIPNFLNEEDVQLLRIFSDELQKVINSSKIEENQVEDDAIEESITRDKFSKSNIGKINQEAESAEGCFSHLEETPNLNFRNSSLKEGMSENISIQEAEFYVKNEHMDRGDFLLRQLRPKEEGISDRKGSGGLKEEDRDMLNVETSGSDTNSTRGRNAVDQMDNGELSKSSDPIKVSGFRGNPEDEKPETVPSEEKHRRKRKRTIMNDKQISMVERALLDEPDMQRNPASIQSWADRLSLHGSEVTSSQLKNWLNNRKARLARIAKDSRPTFDVGNASPDKHARGTGSSESPASPGEETQAGSTAGREGKSASRVGTAYASGSGPAGFTGISAPEFLPITAGQRVVLVDRLGEEVAMGKVVQMDGLWGGRNLEELEAFVVDIDELKADASTVLPYPSDATGTSFREAEMKIGVMRVLWDSNRIFMLQSQ